MTGPAYKQVFIQLAGAYEFVMRNDRLGIQLRIKAIGAMP